jgi:hypothetical protein
LLLPSGRQKESENKPGDEASDVGHVGYATCFGGLRDCTGAVDEL